MGLLIDSPSIGSRREVVTIMNCSNLSRGTFPIWLVIVTTGLYAQNAPVGPQIVGGNAKVTVTSSGNVFLYNYSFSNSSASTAGVARIAIDLTESTGSASLPTSGLFN